MYNLINFANFMRNTRVLLFIIFVVFALPSCKSSFESAMKTKDINVRFTRANEYYDKKQWLKASQLYETLLPAFRGTKNYEELYWRYCNSFYNMKDWMSASYQFKNFTEIFSKSDRVEDAYFLYATSLYNMSSKPSLDQSSTIKGMEVLQTFINMFPSSKYMTKANSYLDAGRAKLEKKDSDAAKLYYNIGYYNAATTSYKMLLFDYPESTISDYYQYMLTRSFYFYAQNSITSKKEERYAEAVNAYNEMKESYPNSAYLADAAHYSQLSQNSINKIRNEQH